MEKTALIIEHFMHNVAPLLNGESKAMIITSAVPPWSATSTRSTRI